MNDFDFKNALISKMKISNRYFFDKNKVAKILEVCDFDIKYTKIFTRKVWDTYCAILKITVPAGEYDFIVNRKKYILEEASELFDRQGNYLLTDIDVGIKMHKSEKVDFSSVKNSDEIIKKSIEDAENFMTQGKYASALDRIHTALHGYLRGKLTKLGIKHESSDALSKLYGKLHSHVEKTMSNDVGECIRTILRSSAGIINSLNELRNNHSLAHPNSNIIRDKEAKLCINIAKDIIEYIEQVIR